MQDNRNNDIEEFEEFEEHETLQQIDVEDNEASDFHEENSSVYTGRLPRKVYGGMWGPMEIAAVAFAGFLLALALAFYLVFVVPAQRELASGRAQRDSLERELISAREKWGDIRDTETQVAKLITSAEDFENVALKDESIGTSAIYQRLNVLIAAYGLRNTEGPNYVPLEDAANTAGGQGDGTRRGRDKFRSIYPGIFISTTVEGTYPNLRRFLRDIETSGEFVAVTAVELEPSDNEKRNDSQTASGTDKDENKTVSNIRKGRYKGQVVSLKIEMAAYFRRPGGQRTTRPEESGDETGK
ncbi:MAG: hypothetical protein R2684_02245 [Pyrinomonadaceae bacterium]